MQRSVAASRRPLDWDDARLLLALLRAPSLVAGARALGIDKSTASRRVEALEKTLGARLFVRTREGLRPSAVGERLRVHAERIEAEMLALTSAAVAGGAEIVGRVRIATTEGMATRLVAGGLCDLRASHPGLELELLGGNRPVDLARGEADLALRFVAPAEAGVVRRRLGSIPTSAWASAAHLRAARRGGRLDPTALAIVSYGAGGRPESEWLAAKLPGASVALRAGSVGVALEAVAAGVGVGVLPDRSAAERSLVKVTQLGAPPERTLWLVLEPRAAKVPRIRAVAEWVAGAVRAAR